MKNIKLHILATLFVGFGVTACTDAFLDVDPQTSILDENFYETIGDLEKALVGCYDGYQRTSSDGTTAFYIASEVLSDNCFGGTGNQDNRIYQALDRFDKSQEPSANNIFAATWESYYAGIFRCNKLLEEADTKEWNETELATINRIKGETKYLRALMYFDMVRLFNNIPLLTTPSAENIPQSAPSAVYKLIADDLKYASQNLKYPAYSQSWASLNDGRATQWAAKSLLARVFLFYTGYYGTNIEGVTKDEVLAGLEDVIANGGFSLISEYKNLWEAASSTPNIEDNTLLTTWAGRGNQEAVFTQKFNYTSDYNGNSDGNRWLVMLGMRNTNFAPYGKGWGACTVNPKLVSAFESADARRMASIIHIAEEGIEDIYEISDQREYTGYSNKKYTPICYPDGTTAVEGLGEGDFQISQYQDYIIIRYADVLLMAAELGSANAQEYYNQVRERAGLKTRTVNESNIMEERRFEFAFEGIRYWDLLRQGIDVTASAIAESNTKVLSGGSEDVVNIAAEHIKLTKGFMQIPNDQITLSNGVLKQNPGW